MNSKFNGKVALITGANKGLGFEMSHQLGHQGFTIVLAARNQQNAEAAAATLCAKGLNAQPMTLDVTDSSQIKAAALQIGKKFDKLDVLVNNAGIMIDGEWGENKTSSTPLSILYKTFATNFFGLVELTQELLPLILKSPSGRIVNMSSIMGSLNLHADPTSQIYFSKPFAYNTSKAAVNSFTIHLAQELRNTSVKVNSAHPGWIKTELGGEEAPMDVVEGAKTGVQLATLPADGPNGGFFHLGEVLPW